MTPTCLIKQWRKAYADLKCEPDEGLRLKAAMDNNRRKTIVLAMRGNRHFRLTSIISLQIYKLWQNADDVSDYKTRLWQIWVLSTWINNSNKHQYKEHQKGESLQKLIVELTKVKHARSTSSTLSKNLVQ